MMDMVEICHDFGNRCNGIDSHSTVDGFEQDPGRGFGPGTQMPSATCREYKIHTAVHAVMRNDFATNCDDQLRPNRRQ